MFQSSLRENIYDVFLDFSLRDTAYTGKREADSTLMKTFCALNTVRYCVTKILQDEMLH